MKKKLVELFNKKSGELAEAQTMLMKLQVKVELLISIRSDLQDLVKLSESEDKEKAALSAAEGRKNE